MKRIGEDMLIGGKILSASVRGGVPVLIVQLQDGAGAVVECWRDAEGNGPGEMKVWEVTPPRRTT